MGVSLSFYEVKKTNKLCDCVETLRVSSSLIFHELQIKWGKMELCVVMNVSREFFFFVFFFRFFVFFFFSVVKSPFFFK